MKIFSVIVLVCLFLANIGQIVYYYPALPERVASHFNLQGIADGWLTKDAFMLVYGGVVVGMTVFLSAIASFLHKIPTAIINVPHKDYWLAPERKKETCQAVARYLIWVEAAVLALLLAVFHLIIRFNLGYQQKMSEQVWILLALFGAFIIGWCIAFFRRFGKPKPV